MEQQLHFFCENQGILYRQRYALYGKYPQHKAKFSTIKQNYAKQKTAPI